MSIFRRLRAAAILTVIGLFLMAITDMLLGMNWTGVLMTPIVVLPLFIISYLAVPLVSKHFTDKQE